MRNSITFKIRLNITENGPVSATRGSEIFATDMHVMNCVHSVPRFCRVCPHCPRSDVVIWLISTTCLFRDAHHGRSPNPADDKDQHWR